MENGHQENMKKSVGGPRWNPTKEQIDILEDLYRQGLRNPTAEQIQQITDRLKGFGHIEGKNVFYWFQNHKARQRQKHKQKQEGFAFYNEACFLHPQPHFSPIHQNVVCQIQNNLGFYQYPKVPLPAEVGFKRINIPEGNKRPLMKRYNKVIQDNPIYNIHEEPNSMNIPSRNHQETLDLFPMHPTGILDTKHCIPISDSEIDSCNFGSENEISCGNNDNHLFSDFLSGNLY